jgi:septal ring factor EnvC (AmiA/AmiB activator)
MGMIEMNGISKIEQLKSELNQKTNELNESLNTQYLLRETLKNNTRALDEVENLLKNLAGNLRYSNEYIDALKQENQGLKLSCEIWMKRAIKLEFEVLSARDAAKK